MSPDEVTSNIVNVEFKRMGKRTTICLLTMSFGMEVVGVSHCQNPDSFDEKIGENAAYDHAFDQAFSLCLARNS